MKKVYHLYILTHKLANTASFQGFCPKASGGRETSGSHKQENVHHISTYKL